MAKVFSYRIQQTKRLKMGEFKMKRKILCHICESHLITEHVELNECLFLGKQEIMLPSYHSVCKDCGVFVSPEQINLNTKLFKIHVAALHEKHPEEKIRSLTKVFHRGNH